MDISENRSRRAPVWFVIAGVCLGAAAVVIFQLLGRVSTPTDASAEAGFARDMASHHAQAVEMAFVVRDATDDQRVRQLAYDIIVTQTAQRGIFMGWLQQWGLNQTSGQPRMAWMAGHGHAAAPASAPRSGSALMPGMATDAELDRLRAAKGKDAEILFLQLMIRHHEGGVEMADALLGIGGREEVTRLARHISTGQKGENKLMTEMLKARGAQPYAPVPN